MKSKTHKKNRFLTGEIKRLTAEIKRLKKDKNLDKDEKEYDYDGTETVESKIFPCSLCKKGTMREELIAGKPYWRCELCLRTKKI